MENIMFLFFLQASPESEGEKERKGREKDKDKENDKSRGKLRGESKQKSPKRKNTKEEVSNHIWDSICRVSFTPTQMWSESLCLSGWMGHIWKRAEWRRAGKEEAHSPGAAGRTINLSVSLSVSLTCIPVMCFASSWNVLTEYGWASECWLFGCESIDCHVVSLRGSIVWTSALLIWACGFCKIIFRGCKCYVALNCRTLF